MSKVLTPIMRARTTPCSNPASTNCTTTTTANNADAVYVADTSAAAATAAAATAINLQNTKLNVPPTSQSQSTSSSSSSLTLINAFDEYATANSLLEYLDADNDGYTDADAESIFQEVSRLTDSNDMRTVDELLLEAERLIQQQVRLGGENVGGGGDNGGGDNIMSPTHIELKLDGVANKFKIKKQNSKINLNRKKYASQQQQQQSASQLSAQQQQKQQQQQSNNNIRLNTRYTRRIENVLQPLNSCMPHGQHTTATFGSGGGSAATASKTPTPTSTSTMLHFSTFVDNLPSESIISQESTPKDMQNFTKSERDNEDNTANNFDNTTDDEDTMEEITEAIETMEILIDEIPLTTQREQQQETNGELPLLATITKITTATTTAAAAATHYEDDGYSVGIVDNENEMRSTKVATMSPKSLSAHTKQQQREKEKKHIAANSMRHQRSQQQQQKQQHGTPNADTCNTRRNSIGQCGQSVDGGGGSGSSVNIVGNTLGTSNIVGVTSVTYNALRRASMTTAPINDTSSITIANANAQTIMPPSRSHASPKRQQQIKSALTTNVGKTTTTTSTTTTTTMTSPIAPMAMYSEKSVGSSPKHYVSTLCSPIEQISAAVTREHTLKQEIEQLQERLKDTEERLESVRIQNDSLSQMQRTLRESNTRLQEESEMLKLEVQHLNECANVLRTELHAARTDRNEALQLQQTLRTELEESIQERKRALDQKEKDGKMIQDLQRQCREMERILVRKHPDSVSALIVASKNPGIYALKDQENLSSRKLLEQRIAQLESDAKEQDRKAQQILANVQARFNSVQSKYETHIADLETQVLSLQEINTKLNEQIESQVRTLQKRNEKYFNNCTQTEDEDGIFHMLPTMGTGTHSTHTTGTQTVGGNDFGTLAPSTSHAAAVKTPAMRDHSTNTIGCPSPSGHHHHHQHQHHNNPQQQQQQQQHHSASSSTSSTANSTPSTSRPNSKQGGGLRRLVGGTCNSKLPISQSESTLSLIAANSQQQQSQQQSNSQQQYKDESQLLANVRSMRVDLAIKNKAMQRLTRELDECKKTIRKLQTEKDNGFKCETKSVVATCNANSGLATNNTGLRRCHESVNHHHQHHHHDYIPANTENQALKEAQNKCRLLEADYKTLHEKRLQDLKTLQSAHERELASCNETVRVLQQRLNERDDSTQKRRKVPVDYYALKAKVSLLERRHSEREERLHMLVEALSKGRLNGALEELLLQENNNK